MKNIIIVLLVVVVGVLGYFTFVGDSNPDPTSMIKSSDGVKSIQQSGNILDLSGRNLKEISKDILDDSSVTTFDVSNNNLTGSLPAEIRKLTNLEILDASSNSMTGVPAEIGQLSKVRIINFANNKLTGLPLELGNLKNLETLDLRGNPNISGNDVGLIQQKVPTAAILTD